VEITNVNNTSLNLGSENGTGMGINSWEWAGSEIDKDIPADL